MKFIEKIRSSEILPQGVVRTLRPDDYDAWSKIAESAWGQQNINQSWDFTALTKDSNASVGITYNGQLVGASLNILKASDDNYLLVHMLGVSAEFQNLGLGKKLMDANYDLIRKDRLKSVHTIKLTSDPLDSRNVRLYLHKCRMHANQYFEDAYQGLSKSGGEKHTGLPSDRLYYVSNPKNAWVTEGMTLTAEQYEILTNKHPEVFDPKSNSALIFVETPEDLEEFKKRYPEKALEWRIAQRNTFKYLFSRGYTAVDHAIVKRDGISKYYIVCQIGFDENNPYGLIEQLENF